MDNVIVNKVANSGLVTLNLEDYLPVGDIVTFDLKDYLFRGLILREKEFREALKNINWEDYQDKNVAIICSADAIIPLWAYMLVTVYLQPYARDIYAGESSDMYKHLFLKNISAIDITPFADQRIIIKGCGDTPIDSYAYTEIARILRPVVKSIMYGEACSNVPIYKKK